MWGHIDYCVIMWKEQLVPEEEWVHRFIHKLDMVPTNLYVQQELRCATTTWCKLVEYFMDTFNFNSDDFLVDWAL